MAKPVRLAIIDKNKCRPKKCNQECKSGCPVNRQGKMCIEIEDMKIAKISSDLCIGCGICVKVCPFGAINIVNLPSQLVHDTIFKYDENRFQLHRLPLLNRGQIMGILGVNGIGKSTMLQILSGKLQPNFGNYSKNYTWEEIVGEIRSPVLKKYFGNIGKLRVATKRQEINWARLSFAKTKDQTSVKKIIQKYCEVSTDQRDQIIGRLELDKLLDNRICTLSGGEYQRLVCAITFMKRADLYIFDEPTSFLDVKQRLVVARMIKELSQQDNYVVIVEHDLAILDYISDQICLMYGQAGAYGVCTKPHTSARAINIFFRGYVPSENMQFRKEEFTFKKMSDALMETEENSKFNYSKYPCQTVKYPCFELQILAGKFCLNSGMTILLGENGTGKTTFLNTLAKSLELIVSYKPQNLDLEYSNSKQTVQDFLFRKIGSIMYEPVFNSSIIKGMGVERLLDRRTKKLSGGEKQIVAIAMCLGKSAQVYLIDEPSAYLDAEQRANVSNIIRRYIYSNQKTCFVVEHDILMATYLATEENSQVVVFEQVKRDNIRRAVASEPMGLLEGMNKFLQILDITFTRDQTTHRPRINKYGSNKDREQRKAGKYFII